MPRTFHSVPQPRGRRIVRWRSRASHRPVHRARRRDNRKPEVAQVAGRHQGARDRQQQFRADRHTDVPKRQADEEAEVAVVIDRARRPRCWRCSTQCRLLGRRRRCFVRRRGAESPRPASAFSAQRFEQIERLDVAVLRTLARPRVTILRTRGVTRMPSHRRSSPVPSARADFGVDFADVDAVGVERGHDRRVALLEERDEQMLGADVVMAVIAALLLGYAEHAPRSGVEIAKTTGLPGSLECSGKISGRLDSNERPLRPERSALPS